MMAASWDAKRLSSITQSVQYGHTASADSEPIGPKFLRITDIQNGTVNWDSVPHCHIAKSELEKYRLHRGDVVFARTGATTGKSFLIDDCPNDAVFASYLIRVRPSETVEPKYLAHFFNTRSYWQQIAKMSQGSGQPGVNGSKLKALMVPLPPLEEQKRIAAILDKADAIRRKRQESRDIANHLVQVAFHHLFGDCLTNANNFPTPDLQDICGKIIDCPHSTPSYSDEQTDFACVRSSDLQDGYIDWTSTRHVSKEEYEDRITRHKPDAGEVLYTREGGRLGNAAQVPKDSNVCLGQRMMLFTAKEDVTTNEFLWAFLNSSGVRHQVSRLTAGAAAPRVNISDLRRLQTFLPPYEMQRQFSAAVERIEYMRHKQMQAETEETELFNSLVQRAFKGEL